MSYNPYNIEGKRILITGASSGIGRATAIECSKLGAACILVGRNKERLEATLLELKALDSARSDGAHLAIQADVTTQEGRAAIVAQCGQLDGVVCNAGINKTAPIYFLKEEELDEVMTTNATAPMMLIHDLVSKRCIKAKASIVFTSSIDAVTPAITTAAYGASKAALTNFMKVCAKELAPRLIRSNAIMPGMVETPILAEMRMTDEELEEDKQNYPLKRYGQPEEIAWAIIYLLSDAAAWVTGSVLTIDGGCSIR